MPPFAKATNPRWQNFLDLFRAMDKGHKNSPSLKSASTAGCFKEDPASTTCNSTTIGPSSSSDVGDYDFRDEVNVEVLGHLFEKSVAEIGKAAQRRPVRIARPASRRAGQPAMPKSAERKRFGTYYTPPEFTGSSSRRPSSASSGSGSRRCAAAHGLTPRADLRREEPSPKLAAYWRDCLAASRHQGLRPGLRQRRVSHRRLRRLGRRTTPRWSTAWCCTTGPDADDLADDIPDMILADNLYGVGPSQQAVEITQLALWLRSARHGKTPGRPVGEHRLGQQPGDRPGGPSHQAMRLESADSPTVFSTGRQRRASIA